MTTMRVFTLSPQEGLPSDESEGLLIIPEDWNALAILDALQGLDLHSEPRGFGDVRARDMRRLDRADKEV